MAIKIVVVGMGPRGQYWLREIQKASAYKPVACVDIDPAVLQEVSSKGIVTSKQCFTELTEALDQNECDAVIVATSPESHVAPCELALSRGVAVMVEKPFTLSLPEAVQLVTLAKQNGAPLIVTQNYRYMRSFRTARKLISDGVLGPVGMVVCQYYRVPHAMSGSHAHLTNSILWGAGIHHIDALRYTLNKRVTGVLAESFTMPYGELPSGGSMQLLLSLENETRAVYSSTYESSGHEFFERGQEFYLRFVGKRATLHVFQRWLILCESGKLPRPVRRGPPTMLPPYDWANTRAFSLPSDQYGWIRINLVGRETKGIVPLNQYEDTCEQLKKLLFGLTNDEGQPLVRNIVSTASNAEHALSNPLPDLVVHWEDAAFAWPLKIRDSKVQVKPVPRKSTGQHASEGFCIYRANAHNWSSRVVEAKDLGSLITQDLN